MAFNVWLAGLVVALPVYVVVARNTYEDANIPFRWDVVILSAIMDTLAWPLNVAAMLYKLLALMIMLVYTTLFGGIEK